MNIISRLLALIFLVGFTSMVQSQDAINTTTILIIRHGEKDTGNNPPLSAAGKLRAEKLSTRFKELKPDEIFSTGYIRTEQTVMPWAKEAGVEIKYYDPKNLPEFAEYLAKADGKNIVIVGHSNTNPQLVNLLLNEDRYVNLNDNDYETIYHVTIKGKKVKVKVINSMNK
jgi:2,3-bisphosphoglycerate-dependent phosphoglycerate mutase